MKLSISKELRCKIFALWVVISLIANKLGTHTSAAKLNILRTIALKQLSVFKNAVLLAPTGLSTDKWEPNNSNLEVVICTNLEWTQFFPVQNSSFYTETQSYRLPFPLSTDHLKCNLGAKFHVRSSPTQLRSLKNSTLWVWLAVKPKLFFRIRFWLSLSRESIICR